MDDRGRGVRPAAVIQDFAPGVFMGKAAKTLTRILRGSSDANIQFDDLLHLLRKLGFTERVRGDHWIFSRERVAEILNLQPKGHLAKPYQVVQVRNMIVEYNLSEDLP